ncbi:MAG: hypothetical protein IT375_33265 [Polyangiaceae bacterium]|nr:hypothetical protein [Polyangiaceae bacterium]
MISLDRPSSATAPTWCCPAPFCSANAGGSGLCVAIDAKKPNGFICATSTPGTSGCTQPTPVSMPQLYCCP